MPTPSASCGWMMKSAKAARLDFGGGRLSGGFGVAVLGGVGAREVDCEEEGEEHDCGGGPEGVCDGLVAHVVRLLVVADGDGGAVDERRGDEWAGDAREAGDGLRDAEHAALLARARALRRERCERRRREAVAD